MGETQSKLEAEKKKGAKIIDCGRHISVSDINTVFHQQKDLPESSKKVFRRAAELVAKCEDYIAKDCEIVLVDGNHLYIIFYAGSLGNKYVVVVNDNNKAETTCVQRSWLRIFYEELFSIYTNVKEAFCEALGVTAVGALAVAVKKAIKF